MSDDGGHAAKKVLEKTPPESSESDMQIKPHMGLTPAGPYVLRAQQNPTVKIMVSYAVDKSDKDYDAARRFPTPIDLVTTLRADATAAGSDGDALAPPAFS